MVKNVYIPMALALVGLLGQHAFGQDVSYVLAANLTSASSKPAVTELSNGTLVANPAPANSTGNLTDPPNAKTNEHDYKVGFKAATRSDNSTAAMVCHEFARITNDRYTFMVSNVTACEHGYVDGLKLAKTNEHDYKVGYKSALNDYSCYIPNYSTDSGCEPPQPNSAADNCHSFTTNTNYAWHVENVTACVDGYKHSFTHWCDAHTKYCPEAAIPS